MPKEQFVSEYVRLTIMLLQVIKLAQDYTIEYCFQFAHYFSAMMNNQTIAGRTIDVRLF